MGLRAWGFPLGRGSVPKRGFPRRRGGVRVSPGAGAGRRPLFWTRTDGELRFASEIQALLAYPDQARRLDPGAAALYAALGYVPAPHTMFAGIHKLAPAHLLVASAAGVTIHPYWDAAAVAARPSQLESPAQLRGVLLAAVERELMSDVPVGVFTSGGLDSSLLAAAAARVLAGEKIHTYAVKFVEPGDGESADALAVTRHIRTTHHVVTADDAALERAFELVTRSLAEPVGDPAILPTYLLAEAAREHVKVVLSGEGADELFGGYPTYLGHRATLLYLRLPRAVRRAFRRAVDAWPSSTGKVTLEFLLKQFVGAAELPSLERHLTWFGALGPDDDTVPAMACNLTAFPKADPLNRILWLDFLSYLPDNLLVKVDRGTMLASIEARAPYLDREVMELVLPAPSALKVRGFTTKVILKEAARGLVPDRVIRRRKRGLSVPVAAAMRAYAEKYAEDAEPWGIVGLLHDFDYERYPNDAHSATEEHPSWGVRLLRGKGLPDALCRAILGHASYCGVPRDTPLAKALFAVDELCGFLVACALVRPSKRLGDLEVSSVKKKLKDKAFARGVNREEVRQGAEELGVPLDEHIAFVIRALRPIERTLGLGVG